MDWSSDKKYTPQDNLAPVRGPLAPATDIAHSRDVKVRGFMQCLLRRMIAFDSHACMRRSLCDLRIRFFSYLPLPIHPHTLHTLPWVTVCRPCRVRRRRTAGNPEATGCKHPMVADGADFELGTTCVLRHMTDTAYNGAIGVVCAVPNNEGRVGITLHQPVKGNAVVRVLHSKLLTEQRAEKEGGFDGFTEFSMHVAVCKMPDHPDISKMKQMTIASGEYVRIHRRANLPDFIRNRVVRLGKYSLLEGSWTVDIVEEAVGDTVDAGSYTVYPDSFEFDRIVVFRQGDDPSRLKQIVDGRATWRSDWPVDDVECAMATIVHNSPEDVTRAVAIVTGKELIVSKGGGGVVPYPLPKLSRFAAVLAERLGTGYTVRDRTHLGRSAMLESRLSLRGKRVHIYMLTRENASDMYWLHRSLMLRVADDTKAILLGAGGVFYEDNFYILNTEWSLAAAVRTIASKIDDGGDFSKDECPECMEPFEMTVEMDNMFMSCCGQLLHKSCWCQLPVPKTCPLCRAEDTTDPKLLSAFE